jgi:ABC-type nitrate/sulfonate/bicarbonate transport system permease component
MASPPDAKDDPAAGAAGPAIPPTPAPVASAVAPPGPVEQAPQRVSKWAWLWTLRKDPPFVWGKLLGFFCLVLVVGVWWLFTRGDIPEERWISPSKLPSPGEVIGAYDNLEQIGLWDNIIASMKRILGGFVLATFVGITLGVLASSYRAVNAFLQPLILFGRSLPLAALIPLTIFWFGIEDQQKIMFIFIAVVPFVLSDTVKAIGNVPQRYVETAQTLGASKFEIITKVLVPLALPDIVTSLRFLFGLALGYVMLAEVINAPLGLGHLIDVSQKRSQSENIYFLLIVIGLLAYGIDRGILFFQQRIFPYRKDL